LVGPENWRDARSHLTGRRDSRPFPEYSQNGCICKQLGVVAAPVLCLEARLRVGL